MAEINIPTGPLEKPPYRAIVPGDGETSRQANTSALAGVLDGLDLGVEDHRIISWLANWEGHTVATVCAWLLRARAASPTGDVIVLEMPDEIGMSWPDGGDLLALTGDTITLTPRGVDTWEMDPAEARDLAAQLATMAVAAEHVREVREASRPVPVDVADELPALTAGDLIGMDEPIVTAAEWNQGRPVRVTAAYLDDPCPTHMWVDWRGLNGGSGHVYVPADMPIRLADEQPTDGGR